MKSIPQRIRVEVTQHFSAQPDPLRPPVTTVVQGRPDEPFDTALRRSFGEPPHGNDYNLVWPNPSGTATWLGWITPHVTLAEAAAVADGETLHVDALGRGGGVLPLMLEIVEAGLTLTGVVQAASWAQTRLRNALSRTQRRLAKEWVDSGLASEPPLALRQYVYSESTWLRSDFDETFGLDRIAGPALLRRLHYDKTSTSPERWEEKPGP